MKHPIHHLHVNKTDVLTAFEFILKTITKEKQSGELKAKLSNLANTYVNNYRPSKYAMKKHGVLKRLCKNNNIVILRRDKRENYEKVYPGGSKPVSIYRTPKFHKLKHNNINGLPLRPIISSIGT